MLLRRSSSLRPSNPFKELKQRWSAVDKRTMRQSLDWKKHKGYGVNEKLSTLVKQLEELGLLMVTKKPMDRKRGGTVHDFATIRHCVFCSVMI
jgi:hypothetical protein